MNGYVGLTLIVVPNSSHLVTKASLSVPFSLLHDTSMSPLVSLTSDKDFQALAREED